MTGPVGNSQEDSVQNSAANAMSNSMSNSDYRTDLIRQRLAVLQPISCVISDDSAQHAGHAGAASGAGHFSVTLVSQKFNGLKLIERHRLVYDAVGDLMQTEIHALAITALEVNGQL